MLKLLVIVLLLSWTKLIDSRYQSEFRLTNYVFCALKSDGSLVAWGTSSYGGSTTTVANDLTSGVVEVFSTFYAIAALKSTGQVVVWGDATRGGDASAVASQLTSGVTKVFVNKEAFAALKSDGSVVVWGNSAFGGANVPTSATSVSYIYSTGSAFAAKGGFRKSPFWAKRSPKSFHLAWQREKENRVNGNE